MMKTLLIFLFFAISFHKTKVHCAEESEFDLSVDYFKSKNIDFICLLSCQNIEWKHKFAKKIINESIMVSTVELKSLDFNTYQKNLKSCLSHKSRPVGVLYHSNCCNFQSLMQWASEEMVLSENFNWLIIHGEAELNTTIIIEDKNAKIDIDNSTLIDVLKYGYSKENIILEVLKTFRNLNLSIDADIQIAVKTDQLKYHLYDIYNYGKVHGGTLNINLAGTWTQHRGLQHQSSSYKYRDRWDFHNLTLRMIVVSTKPKLFKPDMLKSIVEVPDIMTMTRMGCMMYNLIAEAHNFRYEYTVSDRWIGSFDTNSTRVASNSLYFREQDITPILRMQENLTDRLDFIYPTIATIRTNYYYRIPNYGIGNFENQFLSPLSPTAWFCIVGVSTLCCLILLVAAKLECRPAWAQYAIFTVFATICQQFFESGDNNIRRESSARKVTVLVTGISCVLLYNYYTSSVVSWLLNGPPPSINSLRELLNCPLELIFEVVGYTRSWLQLPNYFFDKRNIKVEEELRNKKVFTKRKGDPFFMSVKEGIAMVKAGGYAFHAEEANANVRISETFNKMELCELGYLQSMPKTELYSVLQKRSPYKEFFKWRLVRLKETGHISVIQRRLGVPDISCDGNVPQALALGGAAPAFAMLALGYFASLCILGTEILRKRYKEKNNNSFIVPFVN